MVKKKIQKNPDIIKTLKNSKAPSLDGKIYKQLDKSFKIKKTDRIRSKQIDELYKLIKKKEQEIDKSLSEIVKLKNKMSGLLHKQLQEK